VLAAAGVDVVGPVVARRGGLRLVRIDRPFRLRSFLFGVYGDGWMSSISAYSQFAEPGVGAGTIDVKVSRAAGGAELPATVIILVGPLALDENLQPYLVRTEESRAYNFGDPRRPEHVFSIPAPPPPFRVEVRVNRTFVPADLFGTHDQRSLGAQVEFTFRP
jgi:hypothetical protein